MNLFVSGATSVVYALPPSAPIGILRTPSDRNAIARIVASQLPWACDNDCFRGFNPGAYLTMLDAVRDAPRLQWVTAPDVVGDANATMALFRLWQPRLAAWGIPIALVAQDGLALADVPWEAIACLFIGGSTAWKLGTAAERLICAAGDRGKYVHVGRVNSVKRMHQFSSLPVTSFDGSSFSRWSRTHIPKMVVHLQTIQHRMTL